MLNKIVMIDCQTDNKSDDHDLLDIFKIHNALTQTVREPFPNDKIKFIYRKDPYFYNRDLIQKLKEDKNNTYTVFTNDEAMLHYATFDKEEKHWNILFIQPTEEDPGRYEAVPIWKIYPNVREVNNVEAMFRKGFFSPEEKPEESKED